MFKEDIINILKDEWPHWRSAGVILKKLDSQDWCRLDDLLEILCRKNILSTHKFPPYVCYRLTKKPFKAPIIQNPSKRIGYCRICTKPLYEKDKDKLWRVVSTYTKKKREYLVLECLRHKERR